MGNSVLDKEKVMCKRRFVYLLLAIALLPCSLLEAGTVTGRIFHDANGNGKLDEGEKGLAAVAVSDGEELVLTDKEGKYSINVNLSKPVPLVFISIPSGYMTDKFFSRVADDVTVADFALKKTDSPEKFYFVQFTDTHWPRDAYNLKELQKDWSKLVSPVFYTATGDLAEVMGVADPKKVNDRFKLYLSRVNALDAPVFNVLGNHDIAWKVPADAPERGVGAYRMHLGPEFYSFNYGKVHFMVLNSNRLSEAQLKWLKKDLATVPGGTPLIWLCHIPPYTAAGGIRSSTKGVLDRMIKACENHKLLAILAGHIHKAKVCLTANSRIPIITTTATKGKAYRILRFENDRLFSFHRGLDIPSWARYSGATSDREVNCPSENPLRWYLRPHKGVMKVTFKTITSATEVQAKIDSAAQLFKLKKTFDGIWQEWEGRIDTRLAPDGLTSLNFVARSKGKEPISSNCMLMVDNDKKFVPKGDAVLSMKVEGGRKGPILVNGRKVGEVDTTAVATTDEDGKKLSFEQRSKEITVTVPAKALRKVNKVEVHLKGRAGVPLRDVRLRYDGRNFSRSFVLQTFGNPLVVTWMPMEAPHAEPLPDSSPARQSTTAAAAAQR